MVVVPTIPTTTNTLDQLAHRGIRIRQRSGPMHEAL
jgi:hypothetical protein